MASYDFDNGSSSDEEDAMEDMEEADSDNGNDDANDDGDGDGDGIGDGDRDVEGDVDADDDVDGDGDGDMDIDMEMVDEEDEGEEDYGDDDEQDGKNIPFNDGGPILNGSRTSAAASALPSPVRGSHAQVLERPTMRPEMLTANFYDIIPTIAAPQGTSINAICAPYDARWIFTGGSDGFVRRYNWVDTVNAKLQLTVAQRHPFVDSVTKAGVLMSYWENEEATVSTISTPPRSSADAAPAISPVYSLAVHSQALWILVGDESGSINLCSVRHAEGHRICSLKKHHSAVSVLSLAPDERSVLSGSWDKMIYDWDLNVGTVKRSYPAGASQISTISPRPTSSLPIPGNSFTSIPVSDTFFTNNADKPKPVGELPHNLSPAPSASSQYHNADDINSLFGDTDPNANALEGNNSFFGDTLPSTNMLGDDNPQDDFMAPEWRNDTKDDMNDDLFGDDLDDLFGSPGHAFPEDKLAPLDIEDSEGIELEKPGNVEETQKEELKNEAQKKAINALDEEKEVVEEDIGPNSLQNIIFAYEDSADEIDHPDAVDIKVTQTAMPHSVEDSTFPITETSTNAEKEHDPAMTSETTFLDSSIEGTMRIWDRRQSTPVAQIPVTGHTPPWCMSACWSPDGNFIYAGRRNNTVEEYSLHQALREPTRIFKLPSGSGPVSAVHAMPNGKHIVCSSYDILRLYDLEHSTGHKQLVTPFLVIPGHRTGVISQLYIDPRGRNLLSAAGNRGWDGGSTEVLLGYDILPSITL